MSISISTTEREEKITDIDLQIVFVKKPNAVFSAQIAVDDVMLTGCDLAQPESECQGQRPVRCGNGVGRGGAENFSID